MREAVSVTGWVVMIVGLAGVILVGYEDPSSNLSETDFLNVHVVIALVGAASWGLMAVLTKRYGANNSSLCLVFWLAIVTLLIAVPIAGPGMTTIRALDAGLIVTAALFVSVYSILWVTALKVMPTKLCLASGSETSVPAGSVKASVCDCYRLSPVFGAYGKEETPCFPSLLWPHAAQKQYRPPQASPDDYAWTRNTSYWL